MRVSGSYMRQNPPPAFSLSPLLTLGAARIVEYATREQAQTAVATLSNQNLMGRLVYVREASGSAPYPKATRFV